METEQPLIWENPLPWGRCWHVLHEGVEPTNRCLIDGYVYVWCNRQMCEDWVASVRREVLMCFWAVHPVSVYHVDEDLGIIWNFKTYWQDLDTEVAYRAYDE